VIPADAWYAFAAKSLIPRGRALFKLKVSSEALGREVACAPSEPDPTRLGRQEKKPAWHRQKGCLASRPGCVAVGQNEATAGKGVARLPAALLSGLRPMVGSGDRGSWRGCRILLAPQLNQVDRDTCGGEEYTHHGYNENCDCEAEIYPVTVGV